MKKLLTLLSFILVLGGVVSSSWAQNGSSDDMRTLLHREVTVWSKVIKDNNITAQ